MNMTDDERKQLRKDVGISDKSLANLFNIELRNGKYEFNSNKTVIINGSQDASQELYFVHRFSIGDSWTSISFKYYDTTDLWWIICKFNNVVNPNIIPAIGTMIMIPKKDLVDFILREITISENKN